MGGKQELKSSTSQEQDTSNSNNQRPTCKRCHKHHTGYCNVVCDKCNKPGHIGKDCKNPGVTTTAAARPNTTTPKTCFGCGKVGHFRDQCPEKKKTDGNARARTFNINTREAEDEPDVIHGTFSVNNLMVSVLFDSGADLSFVSKDLSTKIHTPLTPLDKKFTVEVADGKVSKAEHVYRNCNIILADKSFEVDLIPIKLGSFDVIIGMDWLSKNGAEIICAEKTLRIPRANEEPLLIFGVKKCKKFNLINCLKVQKYLRKGCQAIIAHVSKPDQEERRLTDVPIVKEFPEVFPEDLPGLPPHREVEFQIDLVPGAAPVARAPYRLAPSEL